MSATSNTAPVAPTPAISMKAVDRADDQKTAEHGQERQARDAKEIMLAIKGKTVTWLKDPWFQTVAISTGSGAVVLGSVAGAFGAASGMVIGTTAGALPALFTFGLSLPVGAVAGGGMGLCAGAAVGGSTGALCGGAAGHGAYRYRVEIKDKLIYVRVQAVDSVEKAKLTILDSANGIKARVKTAGDSAVSLTLAAKTKMAARLSEAYAASVATVRDRRVQISAASAAGGAAVCAPVGGAVGTCSGIVAGGVIGLVPAVFTFGLSVPFCAAIGGGLGLCAGTVTGGCVGAVGGGSVGFGGYTYRKQIGEKTEQCRKQIGEKTEQCRKQIGEKTEQVQKRIVGSAELVKLKAAESATFARESINARFGGTGGTA